ncbi:MAG: Rpn family recombination-promoting nuclease/putative transposase [Actinomycetaceae bacterium]|nr:Rpn family recombination-promoting nuclease/putative transposase [Actinomycetaceae bacterium]
MPRLRSKEEIIARLQQMRLADNEFMSAFFRHNVECAQFVLRIIMDKPQLVVQEVTSQDYHPNPGWRSATLDVLATDADGRRINIEVQLDKRGASERRARFYASLIDSKALLPNQDFAELPEVWVIFITERDYFGLGKPLYRFERYNKSDGIDLNDGSHIIYVNGANRDAGTALSDLMHDFFCRDAGQMRLAPLAQAVQRFKTSQEGVREMSNIFEEIREELREDVIEEVREEAMTEGRAEGRAEGLAEGLAEGRAEGIHANKQETARQMLLIGDFSLDLISRITSLSIDEVRSLSAEAQGCQG